MNTCFHQADIHHVIFEIHEGGDDVFIGAIQQIPDRINTYIF